MPILLMRTRLALAGKTRAQILEATKAAFDKKELPGLEAGAMGYMMSAQGYLSDRGGHWHPHLMIFVSDVTPKDWGANQDGSPIFAFDDHEDKMTVFLIPMSRWSDGTFDSQSHQ